MTTSSLSPRSKAIALVPLALISGVWTASLMSSTATANIAAKTTPLPDGTSVPANAIEAPANVPVPGVIAPAVPQGSADSVVSGASSNGIPAPALAAYQRGAQIIDAADKTCHIPWELIAAIGRVESDHGRYGGSTLTEDGVSKPGIYGISLNGKNGTQAINDTDSGQLDQDPVFDRAVGPMQFIPSTWQVVKVDADGDGVRNPQDIDDASVATAVYLCSGSDNLSTRKGQKAGIFRYNHSQDYVNLVLRIMEAYSSGDYTAIPSGTYGGTSFSPSYSSEINRSYKVAKQRKATAVKAAKAPQAPQAKATAIADGTDGTDSTDSTDKGGSASGTGTGTASTATNGTGGSTSDVTDTATKGTTTTTKNPAGGVVKGVGDAVGGVVKGVTGSTPTPNPTPAPPKPPEPVKTLTQPVASLQCLADVGVKSVAGLLLAGKQAAYDACMNKLGF